MHIQNRLLLIDPRQCRKYPFSVLHSEHTQTNFIQGPKEDGTIISQMTEPLLEVGTWLKNSGEAIYGTRPWWFQPQDSTLTDVRFTTTTDAFYIIAISKPTGGLEITAPVPIAPGDQVTLLGGSGHALTWSSDNGKLTVQVSDDELNKLSLPAWAFKVAYAT